MEDVQGQVSDEAAALYENFFVPALFAGSAPRIVQHVQAQPNESVLDVACGTGVLARAFADAGVGSVTGLDCNSGMLSVARAKAPGLRWVQGAAEALPFDRHAFDIVASQFGLMFFEDREVALAEMWRVCRPGGRIAVAVWASLEETPGYAAVVHLLERLFGSRVADELRAPYVLGNRETLQHTFAAAGIEGAEVRKIQGTARFPSIGDWIECDIRAWTLGDMLDREQQAQLQREAATALARFATPDGTVAFDTPALLVSTERPR